MPGSMDAALDEGRRGFPAMRHGPSAEDRSRGEAGALARALGWFSIGLGLAEFVAPDGVAAFVGVRGQRGLIRGLGLRELVSGLGILSQGQPAPWLRARVAGDVLDLGLLGLALASDHRRRDRIAVAAAMVLGVTALDALAGQRLTRSNGLAFPRPWSGPVRAIKAVTINRTPREIYGFWRNFENLPRFMTHLDFVRTIDARRSHWRVKGPAGSTLEWDAEITEERPNERIAWRSLEGADVANSGAVSFRAAPGGRGTEVRVELEYQAPGGSLGAVIASLFGEEPTQKLQADLRTFKALMETGEIPRAESSFGILRHAARPPTETELHS